MCKALFQVRLVGVAVVSLMVSACFVPAVMAQNATDLPPAYPQNSLSDNIGLRSSAPVDAIPPSHLDVPPPPPPPPALQNAVVQEPGGLSPEPYRALGLKAGAFIFYPSVAAGYEYTDNVVQSSTNAQADHGLVVTPGLRVMSNWSRHSLRASLSGEYIYYAKKSSPDNQEFDVRVDGRIDVLRGTTIDLSLGVAQANDSGGANQPADGTELSEETSYRGSTVFSQRFNRLAFALRGGFEVLEYSDVPLSGGGTQTNGDRDYTEYDLGLRTSYELSPALTGFVDTSYQPRRYKQKVDDNGLRRDSDGYEALLGGVINYDAIWQGEAAIGYAWRRFDDPSFKDANSFIFRTALTWQPSRITRVRFTADSDIEETSVSTAAAVNAYTAGVRIDHSFREQLAGFGSANFTFRDFSGSSEQERVWQLSSGLEYFLNRNLSLLGAYEYEHLNTNQPQGDYSVNTVSLKVKVKR